MQCSTGVLLGVWAAVDLFTAGDSFVISHVEWVEPDLCDHRSSAWHVFSARVAAVDPAQVTGVKFPQH